jgi:hypothetical protein
MAFLYDGNIIATKQFSATTFTFKIWDLYSNFDPSNQELVIRASLADPSQLLPSQAQIEITINFPPVIGNFTIIPTSG